MIIKVICNLLKIVNAKYSFITKNIHFILWFYVCSQTFIFLESKCYPKLCRSLTTFVRVRQCEIQKFKANGQSQESQLQSQTSSKATSTII